MKILRPIQSQPSRRELLSIGLGGFTCLGLADLLQLRTEAATSPQQRTAVILVWLRGGASHVDTFDPKPLAPDGFRGPFRPIATDVVGIKVTELLPRLAKMASRYSLLRSIAHSSGGHFNGSRRMLSGDLDPPDVASRMPRAPDWMTVANALRGRERRQLPRYVGVNPVEKYDGIAIAGPNYLGTTFSVFPVEGDPSRPDFALLDMGVDNHEKRTRIQGRAELRSALDQMRGDLEVAAAVKPHDHFMSQAFDLMLSPQARVAFDLTREPLAIRERYGMHQWGQQCLLARRLVEAGVEIITTQFDGPLCGRVKNWDDHAVNHHVFDALQFRMPYFDQAVSTLINDLHDRGLDRRVLVVVAGEFGRSPQINPNASSGGGVASGATGTKQPGRDHWPQAGSVLLAGGGIQTGQVIGATDRRGEAPTDRRVGPEDLLATIYQHLGFNPRSATLHDATGRPLPILEHGSPIAGLLRQS
ncbi:MAG: DUF1501 domain-containing protein [Planctomycetes bacterium]|nr:DUF1501 domain-containing protein [Planctomycetota bacterium]